MAMEWERMGGAQEKNILEAAIGAAMEWQEAAFTEKPGFFKSMEQNILGSRGLQAEAQRKEKMMS